MAWEKDAQANQQALFGNVNAANVNNQGPTRAVPGLVANQTPMQSNMHNQQSRTVVGVFENRGQAETAINQLRQQGFSDNEISIVAKKGDVEGAGRERHGAFQNNDSVADGVFTGGALGGVGALLAAAGIITLPVLGPVIAMGPIAAALSGAAAGGVVGGLVDWGVPEERGRAYENKVQAGSILAIIRTNSGQVNQAAEILRQNGATDVEAH